MKKNQCNFCNGTCDKPDIHCDLRLHMSYITLSELIMLLEYSVKYIKAFSDFEIDDCDADMLNCANHWLEHLRHLLLRYENCRSRSSNGRKFIVDRIYGFLR